MARYVELIVSGDDRDLKAYLAGLMTVQKCPPVVFADDAGFHIQELREWIRHHGEVQHVLVEESQADAVRTALAGAAPRYRFQVKAERRLDEAHFSLSISTPSHAAAEKIKSRLQKLPEGVRLEGYVPRETTDPSASSAELYSPSHEYCFEAEGTIRGDVFAVAEARATLRELDFVDCDEIRVAVVA